LADDRYQRTVTCRNPAVDVERTAYSGVVGENAG